MMDWTGGSRRRYAGGKVNATTQKQKAHFARVRASFQCPTGSQNGSGIYKASENSYSRSATRNSYGSNGREVGYEHKVAKGRSQGAPIEISSDRSSSCESGGDPHADLHEGQQRASMDDQELRLLANRRRLLARSDWLGLASAKPLRMTFPAVNDAEQVGRRRKVKKPSSHRAKPAQRRTITPVFEKDWRHTDYVMSGALPAPEEDQLEIRIGTEAFASQSLRSRQSQTPNNFSTRNPSTELALMSEESMLLGADGDTFDANQVVIPAEAVRHRMPSPGYGASVYAQAGSQLPPNTQESYGVDHSRREMSDVSSDRTPPPITRDYQGRANAGSFERVEMVPADYEPSQHHGYPEPPHSGLTQPDAEDRKTENLFRHFLGVPTEISDRASRAALHSGSQHVTGSDSSSHLVIGSANAGIHALDQKIDHDLSTPHGDGTHVATSQFVPSQTIRPSQSATTNGLQSPSESLRMINRLANQRPISPPLPITNPIEPVTAHDDDAAWRQFIIGSQDSDNEPSNGYSALRRHDTSNISQPGSPNVSGLGTSQIATQGRSIFQSQTAPSSTAGRALQNASNASRAVEVGDSDVAVRGSALERDSIEDQEFDDRPQHKPTNIRATGVAVLNLKRFKRPAKQRPSVTAVLAAGRQAARSLPSKTSLGRPLQRRSDHDVYDIVDSDGNSLA